MRIELEKIRKKRKDKERRNKITGRKSMRIEKIRKKRKDKERRNNITGR